MEEEAGDEVVEEEVEELDVGQSLTIPIEPTDGADERVGIHSDP